MQTKLTRLTIFTCQSQPMSWKVLVNMTSIQSLCSGIDKKGGMPWRDPPPTVNSAGAASAARSCSGWPSLTTTYLLHHHCTMHHVLLPCNDRCGAIAEIWWPGFRARTLVSAALELALHLFFIWLLLGNSASPLCLCDSTKIDTLQPPSLLEDY